MRATRDTQGGRRPRISWKNLILGALVLFGGLAYLHFASRKFAWWKQAAFAGTVVGKEARSRATDAAVPNAVALELPARHRFFLQIADGEGTTTAREVVVSAFRQTRVGDRVDKKPGSYTLRRAPAPPAAMEPPET